MLWYKVLVKTLVDFVFTGLHLRAPLPLLLLDVSAMKLENAFLLLDSLQAAEDRTGKKEQSILFPGFQRSRNFRTWKWTLSVVIHYCFSFNNWSQIYCNFMLCGLIWKSGFWGGLQIYEWIYSLDNNTL